MAMTKLTMAQDGLNAVDLGIIGESQYALSLLGGLKADVWRRKAAEAWTYGGWRWECSSKHPGQYAAASPVFAELAARIAAVDAHAVVFPKAVAR